MELLYSRPLKTTGALLIYKVIFVNVFLSHRDRSWITQKIWGYFFEI